ncbi:DUF4123 domain-containing protein [Paracoccus lutimaris]|uniref:Uncharacterized protein DUF4123 n=1 Tax=Paracoccus lutimaris TaxID=1490030 RepID=A0A368Z8G8_9RHOB|nr:DUF4123 domain-containing protein [Paracoccus lutimaris]RCW88299.1 uncharacterized protein DUF4123 [Paracoccus lutimaris]
MLLTRSPVRNDGPRPAVPPALREALPDLPAGLLAALYGPQAPSGVYMLVDATLRREVSGIFDLDGIALPSECLFNGEAALTHLESAPWIVDMSIRDPDRPTNLGFHRRFFAQHWPVGTSLLVQSDASFAQLRSHLRRFVKLRVRDDGGRRIFRFWDPRVLHPFLEVIKDDAPRLRRLARTDDGTAIRYLIRAGDQDQLYAAEAAELADTPVEPLQLRLSDFDPIARAREIKRRQRIADRIQQDFPAELSGRPRKAIDAAVEYAVNRFGGYGFREHAHLHFFAAWTVFYGPEFEMADPTGRLHEICQETGPELQRFKAFRDRFDSFEIRA